MSRLAATRRDRSLRAKISGEGVVPGEYFFVFYKTRHILLSESANCTVLRVVVLTQYRRVTDGRTDEQTDGNAIASTALAMQISAFALPVILPVTIKSKRNNNSHIQVAMATAV